MSNSIQNIEKRVTVQKFHKVVELEDARPSETIVLKHFDRQSLSFTGNENIDPNQRPPCFLSEFSDTHVQAGERAEFSARLTPTVDSSLQLRWSHNRNSLDVVNNRRINASFALGQVRLSIVDVQLEDAGVYICEAINTAGQAVTAGALSVTSRHEYSHSYRTELAQSGGQQLNQRRIVEEKTAQHTIERVQTPIMPPTPSPVLQPPRFLSRFEHLRLEEGSNAHLHARFTSDSSNLQVQWLFNGGPLVASERISCVCSDGYVAMNIYCARLTDQGTYTCVIRNHQGVAQLDTLIEVYPRQPSPVLMEDTHQRLAELERHASEQCRQFSQELLKLEQPSLAPRFKTPLKPQIVPELGSALFETHLFGAQDDRLQVDWFKDGCPLQPATRISTFCSFGYISLRIDRCVMSDEGEYSCVVSNSVGQDSTSAPLQVIPAQSQPEIDQSGLSQSGWIQLQRLEESHSVQTSSNRKRPQETLEPPQSPPRFLTPLLGKHNICEGQPILLEAKLYPESDPLEIVWYKDAQPLQPASRIQTFLAFGYVSLRINVADLRDAGQYTCIARNEAGEDSVTALLKVQQPEPEIIQKVYSKQLIKEEQRQAIRNKPEPQPIGRPPRFIRFLNRPHNPYSERSNLHLEAQVEVDEQDEPLQVQWLHNERPLPSGHRFVTRCEFGYLSLDLLTLTLTDSGIYTLIVSNSFGSISDEVQLKVQPDSVISAESQFPESLNKLQRLEQTRPKPAQEPQLKFSAPRFTRQLTDLEVTETFPVHLECRLEPCSDPQLRVQWFKDECELQSANRISLFCNFGYAALAIKSAEIRDTGVYRCVTENAAGRAESICRLTVRPLQPELPTNEQSLRQIQHLEDSSHRQKQDLEEIEIQEKPHFLGPLQGRNQLQEGEHAHFETKVEPQNDPNLRIKWFKDNQELTEASRLSCLFHFGFVSLDIRQVESRDAGEYRCVASNKLGEAEVQVRLNVLEHRTIIREALLEDSWRQIQRLEKLAAQKRPVEDEQLPHHPPRFLSPLSGGGQKKESENAHFETRLEPLGDPTLQVHWYHNNKPLPEGHRFRRYFEFGYVALDILYVYSEDAGEYRCHATNAYGESEVRVSIDVQPDLTIDRSQMYGVDIDKMQAQRKQQRKESEPDDQLRAPRFILHLQPPFGEYNEGENARFEGKLEHLTEPNPCIEWFFEDRPLPSGSRYVTRYDFDFLSLDIRQLLPEDSGRYRVRVSNRLGSAESEAAIVVRGKDAIQTQSQFPDSLHKLAQLDHGSKRINRDQEPALSQPPKFVKLLQNAQADELRNVHIEARLMPTSDPSMRIEWYKDDKLLPAGHRFRPQYDFDYVALDVLGVYTSDAGRYRCVARNEFGQDQTECEIQIRVIFGNVLQETQHEASLQQIAYLEAHPNRVKRSDADADLALVAPAKFTRHFNRIIETTEGVHVHSEARITPSGDPTMQVLWYCNDKPLPAGHRHRPQFDFDYVALDLLRVQTEDAGLYRCVIRNAYGEDHSEFELRITGSGNIEWGTLHPSGRQGIEQLQRLEAWTESRKSTNINQEPALVQPPHFTHPLPSETIELTEGDLLQLQCLLEPTNDPKLRVEWFLDGFPLTDKSRLLLHHEFGLVQLQLNQLVSSDQGTYTCRALNEHGKAETNVRVQVMNDNTRVFGNTLHPQGEAGLRLVQQVDAASGSNRNRAEQPPNSTAEPPVFRSMFSGLECLQDSHLLHTQCLITPADDSRLTVQLFKDGQPLRASHRIRAYCAFGQVTLQIADLCSADEGEYQCVVENLNGRAEQRFILRLQPSELSGKIPRFVRPLPVQPPTLPEGQSLRVDAYFEPVDDSRLQMIWYKDGQELRQSSRIRIQREFGCVQLELRQLGLQDAGEYRCLIRNEFGEDSSSMRISCAPESSEKVYMLQSAGVKPAGLTSQTGHPPVFSATLPAQVVCEEGQRLQLKAQLIYAQDTHYEINWFLNKRLLPAGHRYRTTSQFGDCCLDVLDMVCEDSGVYTCKAENQFGSCETSCTVNCTAKKNVIEEPQLPVQLANQSVERIRKIELFLQRKRSSQTDETDGSAADAPIFLTPLSGTEHAVQEGVPLQLSTQVEPTDDPQLRLIWYKDGHELREAARIKCSNEFGRVKLEISPCWPADAGVYTCKAINAHGEALVSTSVQCEAHTSIVLDSQLPADIQQQSIDQIARIEQLQQVKFYEAFTQEQKRLAQRPRFICPLPDELQVSEGGQARLQCQIEPPAEPSTKVQWLHNGRQLLSSSRIHTSYEFGQCTLEILNFESRDSGVYTCHVRSEFGECIGNTHVHCINSLEKHELSESGQMQQIFQLEQHSASTRSVQKQQTSSTRTSPPKFLNQFNQLQKVEEGVGVKLQTQLHPKDDPTLQVFWYKDGQPLRLGSRIHTLNQFGQVLLELKWTLVEDTGLYTCKAVNSVGSDELSARIEVLRKPGVILEQQLPETISLENLRKLETLQPPSEPIPSEQIQPPQFISQMQSLTDLNEGDAAHFECRLVPTNDPKLEVSWYFNGQPLLSGHRYRTMHDFGLVTLDILDVYAEDSGEYSVKAVNQAGQDVCSANLHCRAKPSLIYQTQLPNKTMEMGIQRLAELETSRVVDESTDKLEQVSEKEFNQPRLIPPQFVTEPEPQEVVEGEYTRFSARITGHPRPRIFWVINGETVVNGSKYKLSYDGIYHLDIPRARQSDNGKVEVFAKNVVGECYASTTLTVYPKHDDYRAVLKNSPRPWYDYKISKYQQERKEQELNKVFDEKLTPGGTEIARWSTQQTEQQQRIKVQEHVLDETIVASPPRTQAVDLSSSSQTIHGPLSAGPDTERREKTFIERSKETLEKQPKMFGAHTETGLQGKQITATVQKQVQQQESGDLMITRKLQSTETREQERKRFNKDILVPANEAREKVQPPLFTKKLEPLDVLESDRAVFECEFAGFPIPEIVWFRENFPIQNSNDFQIETTNNRSWLTICHVYPEDAGVFSVKAENKGGSAKSTANLIVSMRKDFGNQSPPTFSRTLNNVRCKAGELLRLDVVVTGTGFVDVHWLKDGVKIEPSIGHKMLQDGNQHTLLILEASVKDSGKYDCVAVNQNGKTICSGNIEVGQAQQQALSMQQRPHHVDETKTLKLSTNTKLTSNVLKEKSPQILEHLTSVNVQEGKTASFRCRISNVKNIQVVWYKNDSLIKPSRFFRMASERDCFSLTISEAFPEDEGTYKCVATNATGSVQTSANLQLTASEFSSTQPHFIQPTAQIIHEPHEARPPLSKQQLLHQQKLQLQKQQFQQQQTQQQQIQSQQNINQPRIQQSPQKQKTKEESKSPATSPPQIKPLVAQTAGVNRTIRFETNIVGIPPPTLSWFKDGNPLVSQDRLSYGQPDLNRCFLQIDQVQLSDSGMFTLCAENIAGRSKSTAQLLVVEDEQMLENAVITTTSKSQDGQQVVQRKQQQSSPTEKKSSPEEKKEEKKKTKQTKKKSK